jgi:glycosyltransferase involved in cell wall biosynthesis
MVAACPLPYPRGTPLRIHGLADTLARRGHEVHVVTYHLGGPDSDVRYHLHRIARVPTYRKLSPGPTLQKLLVLDPLLAIRLRGVLRRLSCDVIHAHHYEGLLAGLAANLGQGLPLVFDAHTLLEAELPFYRPGKLARATRRLGRLLDTRLPPRAHHVIAVTDSLKARLLELGRLGPDDVSVIGNGVEPEIFDVPPAPSSAADPEVMTAIFTGNLAAYQGVDLMVRAFASLVRARPAARLIIVTESSFEPYEALARELGVRDRIDVYHVPFEALPPHLAAADVALNPRVECDGIPYKLLNYMAAGKAIVSFEGSARFLVHEANALVVPNGDIDGFARAVTRLFDAPGLARRLGENARQLVRDTMSWDAAAAKVEAVFARLGVG